MSYQGAHFALLTQHGKEQVFAPLLDAAFGARLERVGGFDTDTLGTFTRTTPRPGSQREAAQRKARLAVALSGQPFGLGSEGSFTPGPFGLGTLDLELVCLVDEARGLTLFGQASGPGHAQHAVVHDWAALAAWAPGAGFPEAGLVLRPEHEDHPRVHPGLRDWEALRAAFASAQAASATGAVFVESDLRAHLHPPRRATIAAAVKDLINRMKTPCPACAAPGFGPAERLAGLPCEACGAPTRAARAEAWCCVTCPHREVRALLDRRSADPGQCDECNP